MRIFQRAKKRGPVWFMEFHLGGRQYQRALKGVKSRKEAQESADVLWGDMLRKHRLGELAGPSKAGTRLTLGEALTQHVKRPGIAETTRKMEEQACETLAKGLSEFLPVMKLSGADIEAFKSKRQGRGVSASRINIELRVLRTMLNRLARLGTVPRVPCKVELMASQETLTNCLTREQAVALLAECQKSRDKTLCDVVTFLLNSGLRRSEFFSLRWRNVDLREAVATVETRKRGNSATLRTDRIPLNAACLDVLTRRKTAECSPDDLIFGVAPEKRPAPWNGKAKGDRGTVSGLPCFDDYRLRRKLKAAAKRAGITWANELRLHDLRHACATLSLQAGGNIRDVAALLRHRDPTLTLRRYAHATASTMRETVDRLSLSVPLPIHCQSIREVPQVEENQVDSPAIATVS